MNHSIVIAVIISIIRFKAIAGAYYPFIAFIWLGFINESLSLALIYTHGSNSVNSNIYVVLEFLVLLYQFYKWNDEEDVRLYLGLAITGVIIWIADNFIINSISQNNSIFRASYSMMIVILSIFQVNKIVIFERTVLIKNACFIICFTFLLYFGCKAFIELFNIFHLSLSIMFFWNLWIILYVINFIGNLLYAISILCIPSKIEFTLPY